MVDDATPGSAAPAPRCMWCSAVLPSANEATCPSCGAALIEDAETQVPGVTAIDAEAIVRAGREVRTKPRSRLMSWISGEYDEGEKPAPPGSLAPPPIEVRREMLRLELAAQVANLQAEAGAMAAEAAVESGEPLDVPDIAAIVGDPSEITADLTEDDVTVAESDDRDPSSRAAEPEPGA
jgi:hypothetical protein